MSGGGGTRGLLLAAGAGLRAGGPKALRRDPDGSPWLARSVAVLADGGCAGVTVVLGAAAEEARGLLPAARAPADLDVVVAEDWAEGMGRSLRAGLRAVGVAPDGPDAVLVSLVDLPDVTAPVVARVLACAAPGPGALARAAYRGVPGHPVLLGREHWAAAADVAAGDRGARDLLAAAARDGTLVLVECGDLATGRDVDR